MNRFITATGLAVANLAERASEAGRLSRGRALFRKGAVDDLTVTEGSVSALVRGSGGDRYVVSIGTSPAPPGVARQINQALADGQTIDTLTEAGIDVCPSDIDVGFSCECPDWDEPCKHVVAALLAFADRVDLDGDELLKWRGLDVEHHTPDTPTTSGTPTTPDTPTTPGATSTANTPGPPAKRRGRPPEVDAPFDEAHERSERLSDLKALLGGTAMAPRRGQGSRSEDPTPINAELSAFLGVGRSIEAPEASSTRPPAPLFAEVQLGPLADLGPTLAAALTAVTEFLSAELDHTDL